MAAGNLKGNTLEKQEHEFDNDDEEQPNTKMGEDVGEVVEPPKKKYKEAGPRVLNEDGTSSRRVPRAQKYKSQHVKVTKRVVLNVLKNIFKARAKLTRFPGVGHIIMG